MELDHEPLQPSDSSTAELHKKGSEKHPACRAFQGAEIPASREANISLKKLEQFARTACRVRGLDCDDQYTPSVRNQHEQGPATIRRYSSPLRTGCTSEHQTLHAFAAAPVSSWSRNIVCSHIRVMVPE